MNYPIISNSKKNCKCTKLRGAFRSSEKLVGYLSKFTEGSLNGGASKLSEVRRLKNTGCHDLNLALPTCQVLIDIGQFIGLSLAMIQSSFYCST